jgi:hypothetical protein
LPKSYRPSQQKSRRREHIIAPGFFLGSYPFPQQVLDHSARNGRKEEARQRDGEATQRRTAPSRRTIIMAIAGSTKSTQHPIAAPVFRCRPDRVSGIPSCRDSLPFAADNPTALFHEKESPGIPPLLFATLDYRLGQGFGLEWWLFMTVKLDIFGV